MRNCVRPVSLDTWRVERSVCSYCYCKFYGECAIVKNFENRSIFCEIRAKVWRHVLWLTELRRCLRDSVAICCVEAPMSPCTRCDRCCQWYAPSTTRREAHAAFIDQSRAVISRRWQNRRRATHDASPDHSVPIDVDRSFRDSPAYEFLDRYTVTVNSVHLARFNIGSV